MTASRVSLWGCAGLLWLGAGCAGAEPAPEPAVSPQESGGEAPADSAAAEPAPAAKRFDDMTPTERGDFMAKTVVPTLKPLFQGFDSERFADFECKTCHGDNAQEVQFQMPNGLAPLDATQLAAIFESDEPMAKFMTGTVWPKMAELLGRPRFDLATGEGFSCLNCHATKVR